MFSVGVNPTSHYIDGDGVMVVTAGDWHHTALLPFGAFADAVVTDVAATQPPPTLTGEHAMTAEIDTAAPDTTIDAANRSDGAPAANAAIVAAPPAVIPLAAGGRQTTPPLTLDRIAHMVASANRGEITTDAVRATIAAALANVTTTDVGEVVQPAYRAEINGLIDHGTPLLNALAQAPLPTSGMTIEYPEWVTKPTTGQQATEKTQITSTAVDLIMRSAPVVTIAGGNDISLQAVERSSPSFLAAYLRAAAVDWSRRASTYAITRLLAAATAATPGANFLANVQAMLTALSPETTPPGPLWLGMAYNVGVSLVSVTEQEGPAFWEGSLNFGDMTPDVDGGGLNMFIDWNLPADTMILGSQQSATWHQSAGAPADIRVIDVSLLGLDVGVYGYVCLTIEYPAGLVKMDLTP
jgi:hypothetical protein